MNPVIMHINYGEAASDRYGGNTIDDICRMAADVGFDGIEFRGTPPRDVEGLTFEEYVKQIAAARKKYNLSHIMFAIGPANCISEDKELRAAGVQKALEDARFVHDMCGTTLCNTFSKAILSTDPSVAPRDFAKHGSAVATQDQWDMTVEVFQQFAKGIEPLGMKFAFETHMKYIHDLPETSKKLVDLIDSPNIGINMDYGNTVYFAGFPSVEETIDIYGDKLFYTHLKNSIQIGEDRKPTALSEGTINHRRYLKKLEKVGFDGFIGIECTRPGDRCWFAQQDMAYYKALRNSI